MLANVLAKFQHLLDGLAVGAMMDELPEVLALWLHVLYPQLTNIANHGFGEILGQVSHLPRALVWRNSSHTLDILVVICKVQGVQVWVDLLVAQMHRFAMSVKLFTLLLTTPRRQVIVQVVRLHV